VRQRPEVARGISHPAVMGLREAEVIPLALPVTHRAGFVSRFAAFFADAVILTALLRGTVWILNTAGRAMRSVVHRVDMGEAIAAVIPLLVGIYLVTFWRLSGQTPGKWLMGLKVVPIDGRPLSTGRAVLRFLGYLVSALPFYAGFLWILGPQRRAWHDLLARTEVIYVPRARSPRGFEPLETPGGDL
jgi:uncharacterized RDD family membrane protein YckC